MKAILEFNLPDDQEAFDVCKDGLKWRQVVIDIDNYLRGESKYQDNDLTSVAELREKIREICDAKDLKMW
jgi:hypothetical protein